MEGDLRGGDEDEELHLVEGAQVQVLGTGVGDRAHVGQQLPGYRQLNGPDLMPLDSVL